MSQAGLVDIEGSHPQIPTEFVTDNGIAVPIANVLEILGTTVAAHNIPLETTGSGNTVTIEAQFASAIAATDATKVGFASFNSANFTVDANGFVSFVGGSVTESFNVDAHTAPGTDPVVPDGSGMITVTGGQVAAGTTTNAIQTNSLAANTYTIQIQRSQAVGSSTVGDNGVSHFDSAAFDVDANGFVQLNGGGIAATSFDVQANTPPGTDPVVPSAAGIVIVNGAAVANHSVVLETRSRAVNSYNLEVQYATSAAATDATKSGVAHFNSTQFSVDANGFVQLAGGGEAIDSVAVQTGTSPIVPTAGGLITINGATVAAGTNPVRTDGTGANTMAVEVQISQAIAATDATKIGLANFNSAHFSVDANGFVSLAGGGLAIDSIHPNSGTDPVVPDALGAVSILGTGSVTAVGSLNTLTLQLTGLTNHAVLVGAGTATITKVGPSATAGQVFQSGGASADPSYSTATYPSTATGTGKILRADGTNWVPTTATYPDTAGTSGNVLTSNGTNWVSQAPAASGFTTVVTQTFTASGTYTPTANMKYCIIECVGAGGGGGGVGVTTGGGAAASGGGAGSYAYVVASAATIGVSQTVTIGTAGTAGSSSGGSGGTGGDTSVGTIAIAVGGFGGTGSATSTAPFATAGVQGRAPTTSQISARSASSFGGLVISSTTALGGNGSSTIFGGGGFGESWQSGAGQGPLAGELGGGGGGAAKTNSGSGQAGMAGGPGFVKITEFI